ncbi:hypothetical protein M2317_000058 [Microbacterium sp. ZKA21]|uniref:helix-turn-helix domain-containing protein n=1 Tax=Microbacterium sp. ZKA21 TaxID=3381694 RepID=UPI003D223960
MARTEHKLTLLDDSGITSVAVCVCGRTFIGVGPERNGDARIELAVHAHTALTHHLTPLGKEPKPVDRETLRAMAAPGKRNSKRERLGAQAIAMREQGETLTAIASALGVSARAVSTWLKDAAA